MKKIILFLILSISNTMFSQNIFDKYEEKSDVSAVIVSQKMFEMFSNIDATDKDAKDFMQMFDATWPGSKETIARTGCTLIASNRAVNVAINLFGCNMETPAPSSIFHMLDDSSLTCADGMIFSGLKNYLAAYGVDATIIDTGKQGKDISKILEDATFSEDSYLVIGRIPGTTEDHYVNINSYSHSSKKVNATDTSISKIGQETRDLKSVDVSTFDRLILIKVKSLEEN